MKKIALICMAALFTACGVETSQTVVPSFEATEAPKQDQASDVENLAEELYSIQQSDNASQAVEASQAESESIPQVNSEVVPEPESVVEPSIESTENADPQSMNPHDPTASEINPNT